MDTTLVANVGPRSRGGLVIGADDITLDLSRFAVLGRVNRTGDGVGIRLSGRTNVTIRSGRVTDFDAGIAIVGGSANAVENVLVKDNIGTTKRGDFGDGIVLSASSGNTVTGNDVIHNGPFDGIALLGAASANLIEGNIVSGNHVGNTADDGIRIEGPGATNNTVRGNTVSANGLDGIAVFSDQRTGSLNTGNVIEANTVTANAGRAARRRDPHVPAGQREHHPQQRGPRQRRQRDLDRRRLAEQPDHRQQLDGQRSTADVGGPFRPSRPQHRLRRERLVGQLVRHRQPGLHHRLTPRCARSAAPVA